MSIKLTSAETGRNKSAFSAAVGTGNKISIAPFTATNIKNIPGNWSGEDNGYVDTTNSAQIGAAVQINNIYITDSSWNILDDTAISTSGGYLKLIGIGFQTGAVVYIQGTPAISTVLIGTTELRVTTAAISSGTLQVYVVNPDNSVAIRLSSLVASGVPNWITTSPLPTQFIDVEINIELLAVSDSTVAYSLQDGSSLPSGVSLSTSGLLTGTITGISTETTYNFTLVATDLELQDTAKVFSVSLTVGDSLFNVTSFLLNTTDKITWVADASSNNNNNTAITIAGDTKPTTFSPYNTNWSAYFDGTGDYLTVPNNAALGMGSGDFTVEFWIYQTALSTYKQILDVVDGNSAGRLVLWIDSGGTLYNAGTSGSNRHATAGGAIAINQWNHVALVRSSGISKFYINGVQSGTNYTDNTTYTCTTGTVYIGINSDGATYPYIGYMSNFRMVKGTAVYTAAFTPPTTQLTSIANTSLLTLQNNRFVDNSTANSGTGFTITKVADTIIDSFGPFTETDFTTGSAYFDGSGDFLSIQNNASFNFGTGDFTIEAWIFPAVLSAQRMIVSKWNPSGGDWQFYTSGTDLALSYNGGSVSTSGLGLVTNQWYHVAISKQGTTGKILVNGIVKANGTVSFNSTGTQRIEIGSNDVGTANFFSGYISNVRVVKGTAVYTANTTPPVVPLTSIENTVLLTLQTRQGENNNRFLDSSGQRNSITRFGNVNQGTFTPYNQVGWSAYFDNAGDYITLPSSAAFGFGTGDFTWECWAYFNSTGDNRLFDFGSNNLLYMGSNTLVYYQNAAKISSNVLSVGQWYHVAVVRSSGITKMYINGTQNGIDYTDTMNYATSTLRIGADSTATQFMNGFISNVRIVKGVAVYTGNFTPPIVNLNSSQSSSTNTAAILVSDTTLLTLQDNRFVDNSNSLLSLTPVGDTKIVAFSPFRPTSNYNVSTHSGSAYFDGTGDYLSIPSDPIFTLGTGDFTIEMWAYIATATVSGILFDLRTILSTIAPSIWHTSTSIRYDVGSSTVITGSAPVGNTWHHIAVSRQSGSTKMYINGLQSGSTYIDNNNYVTGPIIIGARFDASTPTNSYISDLRVTKGVALYTANTTPPTTALPTTANTILKLDFANAGILDYSGRFNLETSGNTSVGLSSFSPYNTYWSGSFNTTTTGDYLTIPDNVAFTLGANNYTIEAWIYLSSMPAGTTGTIVQKYNVTNGRSFTLQAGANSLIYYVGTTAVATTPASSIPLNEWTHVASVRNGSTITLYVNGTAQANGSAITVPGSTTSVSIGFSLDGAPTTYYFPGFISNLRIVNGTALYTSNFTPSTSPLTVVANTSLLTLQDKSFKDNSNNAFTITRVGESRVSDFAPFEETTVYNKSLQYRFKTDYAAIYANPRITVLPGDFTVEAWIFPIDYSVVSNWGLIDTRQSGGTSAAWVLGVSALASPVAGYYRMHYFNSTYSYGTTSIVGGTWTHVAWERVGTTLTFYVNGVAGGTATVSAVITGAATTNPIYIGHKDNTLTAYGTNGYINDFRLTNGTARYNGNFTPPTMPFLKR